MNDQSKKGGREPTKEQREAAGRVAKQLHQSIAKDKLKKIAKRVVAKAGGDTEKAVAMMDFAISDDPDLIAELLRQTDKNGSIWNAAIQDLMDQAVKDRPELADDPKALLEEMKRRVTEKSRKPAPRN